MAQTPQFFKDYQKIVASIAIVWTTIFGLEQYGIELPEIVTTIFNGYTTAVTVITALFSALVAQLASAEVINGKEVEPSTIS